MVKRLPHIGKGFSQPLTQLVKRSKTLDTDRVISTQVCIEPVIVVQLWLARSYLLLGDCWYVVSHSSTVDKDMQAGGRTDPTRTITI